MFGFIFGIVVMWLWNALLPQLFGLKTITYWQGVGLVILARLLFGSGTLGHHIEKHKSHICGGRKQFRAWWQAEGGQAFDAYLARKQDAVVEGEYGEGEEHESR